MSVPSTVDGRVNEKELEGICREGVQETAVNERLDGQQLRLDGARKVRITANIGKIVQFEVVQSFEEVVTTKGMATH